MKQGWRGKDECKCVKVPGEASFMKLLDRRCCSVSTTALGMSGYMFSPNVII